MLQAIRQNKYRNVTSGYYRITNSSLPYFGFHKKALKFLQEK